MKAFMIKTLIATVGVIFCALNAVPCVLTYAGETGGQESPDIQGMRAEYDKISAVKMKKYDELAREITELRDRIEALVKTEQELLGEKEKAGADLDECAKAAEMADHNVKRAFEDASSGDEKMKGLAALVAKESAARKEKIEKLKAELTELSGKMTRLQSEKKKTEEESAAWDTEYKDASQKLLSLQKKSSAGEKSKDGGTESERLTKLIGELEVKTQEVESSRRRLSDEIMASAEKIRASEEEVSALERENASQAKALREKLESFGQAGSEDQQRAQAIEEVKKIAEEANVKRLNAQAALQKIEADLRQVSQEKLQTAKDLVERADELKVRIAALVVQNERDQALLPRGDDSGEKNIKKRLKRAEKDMISLRRKTERSVLASEELKVKFDKEMLDKHFNLAVVYEMNGLYKDAEREYLACLKIDPNDADVHYNLAILYDDRLNNNKKAERHYYKFLSLRPIGESGERVKDWIMEAELERRLGKKVR
jgi:chromosome segregation ATPase